MKYNEKTAVRIIREEDKQDLIPFFEAIKPDCNLSKWALEDIDICDYALLMGKHGLWICYERTFIEYQSLGYLSDYTILNGVPQGWREEMKTTKNIHREIADQYQGLFNLLSKEHGLTLTISEMDEIVIESAKISESRINQLESENKDLRECLKEIIFLFEWKQTSPDKELSLKITQAKQLLNK